VPNFSNMNDLIKYLQGQVSDSLRRDVSEKVIDVVKDHIQKDVYDAYTPYSTDGITPYYERTYQLLEDVVSDPVYDDSIYITDTRSENGKDITEIIETGQGYTWGYRRNLDNEIGSRPFMENAKDEIQRDSIATNALKESLKLKGFNVE
jgi:hypothetical protein